jgi:ribosomal-protein-alanine N-acetyltransferase
MRLEDIPAVHAIESASFPTPWPPYAFRGELESNRMAHYLVVRAGQRVVAYAGLWLMVDEAHVTTFAVLPAYRRRGIGGRLLSDLVELAADLGATVVTLEVRLSNAAARQLYQRFGFRPVGVRPRYYSDNGEDALIMTTEALDSPAMTTRRRRLAEQYAMDGLADDPGWLPDPEAEPTADPVDAVSDPTARPGAPEEGPDPREEHRDAEEAHA